MRVTYSLIILYSAVLSLSDTVTCWDLLYDEERDFEGTVQNECNGGYKVFQNFTCWNGISSAIPTEFQLGSRGYWTNCLREGPSACTFRYVGTTLSLVGISVDAYHVGNDSAVNIDIFVDGGMTIKLSGMGTDGWRSHDIDLSNLELGEFDIVLVKPLYESEDTFTVIDKLTYRFDGEPPTVITTQPSISSTTVSSTTPSTTITSSTVPPPISSSSTTPPRISSSSTTERETDPNSSTPLSKSGSVSMLGVCFFILHLIVPNFLQYYHQ